MRLDFSSPIPDCFNIDIWKSAYRDATSSIVGEARIREKDISFAIGLFVFHAASQASGSDTLDPHAVSGKANEISTSADKLFIFLLSAEPRFSSFGAQESN